MPRLAASLVLLACLAASSASAQSVVLKRNSNLRRDPSTGQPEIRLLHPPQELALLDTVRTNNYFPVILTETSDTGWIYAPNVTLILEPALDPAIATAIDPAWAKLPATVGIFTSPVQPLTCAAGGDGGDTATNRLKNRSDIPASYHAVSLAAIRDLPYPATNKQSRLDWPAESLAVVLRMEGVAVQAVGYLVAVKGGSSEATNCHMTRASEVDWHMAITEEAGEGEQESVVVEPTPRIRLTHPKWTKGRLDPWLDVNRPVRISGWLMFDPSHRNHLGTFRKTLWEIHPITRIEVWQDTAWVNLDVLPQ